MSGTSITRQGAPFTWQVVRYAIMMTLLASPVTPAASLESFSATRSQQMSEARDKGARLLGRILDRRGRLAAITFLLDRDRGLGLGGVERKADLALALAEADGQLRLLESRAWQAITRTMRPGGGGEDPRDLLIDLERRLKVARQAEDAVVARFTGLAVGNLGELERTIAATGLDADALLEEAAKADGRGGPLTRIGRADGGIVEALRAINRKLARWHDLEEIHRVLPLGSPVDYLRVTSNYGWRRDPEHHSRALHAGIDLAAPHGAPVEATAPGKVVFAGWDGPYGRMVEIEHGLGIRTRYAHLSRIEVREGQTVKDGARVGRVGSSGRATGPHVHYEVLVDDKARDPISFIRAGDAP
ncbi:MAG: M23 family metallopeptidase [Alphaproteobacteria bacterium]|nr:M23 family metallopeptidase [Alphaproteobacteria bacterium]